MTSVHGSVAAIDRPFLEASTHPADGRWQVRLPDVGLIVKVEVQVETGIGGRYPAPLLIGIGVAVRGDEFSEFATPSTSASGTVMMSPVLGQHAAFLCAMEVGERDVGEHGE
jgi:hypothetical protein